MPASNASGSTRTTRSNSSPFASSGISDRTRDVARSLADAIAAEHPDDVVTNMRKELRRGKVLIDWSQNTEHKSMVCAYSVRAKARPTVSTPVRWAEVEAALDAADPAALAFEMDDVVHRVAEHGDLFAPVLAAPQQLPAGSPAGGRPSARYS